MNVMMMLERVERGERKSVKTEETTKIANEHDPLMNAKRAKPIQWHNSFKVFTEDVDADDENEFESDNYRTCSQ